MFTYPIGLFNKAPSEIIVKNAGGNNTTDWINPTDGLAEFWSTRLSPITSIVTGNGFVGNAQRMEVDSVTLAEAIEAPSITLEHSTSYQLSLKFRCSANNGGRLFWNSGTPIFNLPFNTGNAVLKSETVMTPASGDLGLQIFGTFAGVWFEVDEINFVKL